jgi:aryl-alcohol dehydrogenase-like predicted oxidoreductase
MEYVRLGKTGLKVSRLCLGCMSYGSSKWQAWVLDEAESLPLIKKAYEVGVNFFDTADVYSNGESERILGKALKEFNIPRERVVIATKVHGLVSRDISRNTFSNPPSGLDAINQKGLCRKHIFEAVEASLQRLQTTYIDLYQIHRWDYETPIEETMEALNDLVRSGKVRYIGASSMYTWQFSKANFIAEKNGWAKFVSMQNFYNLLYREEEREMIPFCQDQGIGIIPWSPLARGVLVGKGETVRSNTDNAIKRWLTKQNQDEVIIERVKEVASKRGKMPAQVAIAWLYAKPYITSPIVGINKAQYLDEFVEALQVKLTQEEISYLEEPYIPKKIAGHF